jgi:cytochrome P450
MRKVIMEIIKERRNAYKNGKKLDSKADLLSIMLNDPLFQNDDEIILNESLTFFVAGSLTQASLLSNTLCFLI